jgi:Zn-dependent protease
MPNEPSSSLLQTAHLCPECGGEIAPNLLSCPSCHTLVYSLRLKDLASQAEGAENCGDLSAALKSWKAALPLLPPESRQYIAITSRITRLGGAVEATPPTAKSAAAPDSKSETSAPSSRWSGGTVSGILATLAVVAWKFKFIAILLLTKAKFLFLGLTKASTCLSMFLAVGVYWTVFGGWFALGLVLSIYVHEMGHVYALSRYGIHAGAPLFVPGLGAFIRLKQHLTDPKQDARVGLAGPIWGLGAALFCLGVYLLTRQPIWAALAQFGALINLFNLLPIWQLDGGRAFRSLSRSQRWLAVGSLAAAWAIFEEPLLPLLIIVGAGRTLMDKPNRESDALGLGQYAVLVTALSALARLPVPIPR